jgi:hypothetical protein
MRAVIASLFAAIALLAFSAPVLAAPPADVAAYCRAVDPDVQSQVRCRNAEQAAAERVARSGGEAEADAVNRCRSSSESWSAMERCLAESVRAAAAAAGAAGGPTGRAPGLPADRGAPEPSPSGSPPSATPAPAPGTAGVPSPSTVIVGPQAPPAAASEQQRQTRAISEADAERQLRGVLDREGYPGARCTRKQYGPGWVTICE